MQLTTLLGPGHGSSDQAPEVFRWHDAGDVQSSEHMNKIFRSMQVNTRHEALAANARAAIPASPEQVPDNLVIRLSRSKIDGPVSKAWTHESSVITRSSKATAQQSVMCPAKQGGKCLSCRQCWNKEIKNVSYWKH